MADIRYPVKIKEAIKTARDISEILALIKAMTKNEISHSLR
jgi:hypothetical protein